MKHFGENYIPAKLVAEGDSGKKWFIEDSVDAAARLVETKGISAVNSQSPRRRWLQTIDACKAAL